MKALAPTMQNFKVNIMKSAILLPNERSCYYLSKPHSQNQKFWYPKNGLFTCYQVKIQI